MIPCQACGKQNPIGTRYCRACGTKIEINQDLVVQAVTEDRADAASARWFERGRSLLIIGMFFMTCALVMRLSVVPPMPVADVPPIDVGGFLPTQLPKSAAAAEAKPVKSAVPKP